MLRGLSGTRPSANDLPCRTLLPAISFGAGQKSDAEIFALNCWPETHENSAIGWGCERSVHIVCYHDQNCVRLTPYNQTVSVLAQQLASADFPTRWGHFRIYGFRLNSANSKPEEAVALVMGDVHANAPLVRIHSQCLTGDVFGSLRCDCRQQLELALTMIASEGAGILIYEQQEGRGIGLMPKLQAYELQDSGLDTVEANEKLGFKADHREFALPAQILKALGIKSVRLLSNNPEKVTALEAAGVKVSERVPCEVEASAHAAEYLRVKKEKLGHLFGGQES